LGRVGRSCRVVPRWFFLVVTKKKERIKREKNSRTGQETSTTSLGPFFLCTFPPSAVSLSWPVPCSAFIRPILVVISLRRWHCVSKKVVSKKVIKSKNKRKTYRQPKRRQTSFWPIPSVNASTFIHVAARWRFGGFLDGHPLVVEGGPGREEQTQQMCFVEWARKI
jgi:hypothetical protein